MSAEIPMERAYQRTCMDSSHSVQCPAFLPAPSRGSEVEHQGRRPLPMTFQDEPVMDKTHPHLLSCPSPVAAVTKGQHQLAATNLDAEAIKVANPTTQQAPDNPNDGVLLQIEQIHKVLQEQSKLLTLMGRVSVEGLMFPAGVPLQRISLLPVLTVRSAEKELQDHSVSTCSNQDGRRPEDHPVLTCPSQDAFGSKKDTAEQRHFSAITGAEQTVHTDGSQDPVRPCGVTNWFDSCECRSAVTEKETVRVCSQEKLEMPEISGSKQLQNISGMMTESRDVLREGEGIFRMDRNNLMVTDKQEVQRKASLSQQQTSRRSTSGIQRHSSAPSMVFKDEGTQLETFQSLTFQPKHGGEFVTLQDFCSGPYNPQTPQYSQRNTQTEIQAQAKVFSLCHSQEHTYFSRCKTPPFQVKEMTDIPVITEGGRKVCQLQERNNSREKSRLEDEKNSDNCHSRETEGRMNQTVGKIVKEKWVRRHEMENKYETDGKTVNEERVEGQSEIMAPNGKMAGATSDVRWEQSLQQNHTHIRTPKYPSASYESNLVQHFNISPCRVPPWACRNQEVIVSFKTLNDHMERVSSSNMETLSTGCDETKTHLHLHQCNESRPGSSTGSNWVKGRKQATTTAAFCLRLPNHTSQAPTPLKHSTFPRHSTTRSTSGSAYSSEDEDNPSSQCHQFPKLPFPPPCHGLQDPHLNPSEDDSARQAEEGWTILGIQQLKQDPRLGCVGDQETMKIQSVKADKKHDEPEDSTWGFHREVMDQDELISGCEEDDTSSDREDRRATRNLTNLGSSEVQALRQQLEALQQQFQQREHDWSVVRRQLDELIKENSELKRTLTVTPQRRPVAGRCTAQTHTKHQQGQTEPLSNSCSRMTSSNRTGRSTSADQNTRTVTFSNGDIKHILADGKMVYHYAGSQITQTTYPAGLEVLHFPNKQIEKRHPGGRREILFPDQTIKYLEPDGSERTIFPDGTIVHLSPSGEKRVDFPSGQREIHTSQYKRREDPDGTVKTIYHNGRQETKYASGRVRIKEKDKIIFENLK